MRSPTTRSIAAADVLDLEGLAAAIKRERRDRPFRDVAQFVGVTASTLYRTETGSCPDLPTFALLCRWLGCAPSLFMPGLWDGEATIGYTAMAKNANDLARRLLRVSEHAAALAGNAAALAANAENELGMARRERHGRE